METIKYVLDHPVEALKMGLKAREKCKREYSWEMMEKKLIAIFEKYKTDSSHSTELDQDISQLDKAL